MKKYYFLTNTFIYLGFIPNLLNAQSPTITSFSPSSGAAGTLITIIGSNLEHPTAFTISGVSAILVSDTSVVSSNYGDTLVGLVMPSATTGIVSVTSASGTAMSSNNFTITPTPYPSSQQGNKLVGTGTVGIADQGCSVSISADGNTAIVGGDADNSYVGAAWVYTRLAGVWTQQGNKLVGKGAIGAAYQGFSVSISADGNTAIMGGYHDNSGTGAAWIFSRSGGIWTQQGGKLVGTGAIGAAYQGFHVSISADGNTAIVGGYNDNSQTGAAWVYTRSGGIWTQQGSKLVGTGATTGAIDQGHAVSISADGNTAIVGGYFDNSGAGAAWIFTRSGGIWTQQGSKLIGTGAIGKAFQGYSVSISADGNNVIVGGTADNSSAGAAWVYTRSGGTWTQQGNKLIGTGAVGPDSAVQGLSVSISADGNTAIASGDVDNSNAGAVWVYTRSGGTWTQEGHKLVGTGAVNGSNGAYQGTFVSLSADGSTAIVGGYGDNSDVGAAWVYTGNAPTGIESISDQSSDILYPNPSNGMFTIVVKSEEVGMKSEVEVYNMLGEKVYSQFSIFNLQFSIDLSNQPTGIYLYRVLSEKGDLISEGKMIIQK